MPVKGVKPGQPRKDIFHETLIWDIIPEKTSLVVIDMQNSFVHEKGPAYTVGTQETVPKINKIVEACRNQGILVSWVRCSHRPDGLDMGYIAEYLHDLVFEDKYLLEGSWNAEFYDNLDVKDSDLIVTKKSYSAFIAGSSPLDQILRYMGKDTIIIAGIATNVCCGTTARDASMLGYKVIFISDANTAFGPRTKKGFESSILQEAELLTLRALFAMVCTTDELLEEFNKIPKK